MSNILSVQHTFLFIIGVKHDLVAQFKIKLLFLCDSAGPHPWDTNRLRNKIFDLRIQCCSGLALICPGFLLLFFYFTRNWKGKTNRSIQIENEIESTIKNENAIKAGVAPTEKQNFSSRKSLQSFSYNISGRNLFARELVAPTVVNQFGKLK